MKWYFIWHKEWSQVAQVNRKGIGTAVLLPENWVRFLVGVELKDTAKPKSGRRKDLLLAASKNNRYLSQSSVSPTAKLGKSEAEGICIFMKGLEQRRIQHRIGTKVDRVQALVDQNLVGQKSSTSSFLRFQLHWAGGGVGGLNSVKQPKNVLQAIFTTETELRAFITNLFFATVTFLA